MIVLTLDEIVSFCGGELINADGAMLIKNAETDSRKDMTDGIFFALKGERFDGHDFLAQALANNGAVLCVQRGRNPVDAPCWVVDDTLKAYQKLGELMLQKAAIPTVGVTGSVGKTSVKEMCRAVLEYKFGAGNVLFTEGNTNNHIGVPQNLMRLNESHRAAVIEMGTSSFGEIKVLSEIVKPEVALINSIAPCHLENLGSLDGVAKEKSAIFDHAAKAAVFPGNIAQSKQLENAALNAGLKMVKFGDCSSGGFDFYYCGFRGSISGSSFKLCSSNECVEVDWSLQGEHQAQNACAAAAVGAYFGMSLSEIAAGLKNTTLPGMRAKITEKDGVHYYNDAYNANPASMTAVLKMITDCGKNGEFELENVILVIGDMLELGENSLAEHRNILQFAAEKMPQAKVLAVGENYMHFANDFDMEFFADSKAAGKRLADVLAPGKWVFLKGSRSMKMENALTSE